MTTGTNPKAQPLPVPETAGGGGEQQPQPSSPSEDSESGADTSEASYKEESTILPTTNVEIDIAVAVSSLDEPKKKDADLDPSLLESMELAGLGYSGKVLEKAEESALAKGMGDLRSCNRKSGRLEDDGLLEDMPPVAPSAPRDGSFVRDGRDSGVQLALGGGRPEIVAAPGPSAEASRIAVLSSRREAAGMDFAIPAGMCHEGAAATTGGRNVTRQSPSPSPGAVATPGTTSEESSNSENGEEQAVSDYATTTPFDADVVVDEETQGQERPQQDGRINFRRPALDPNETVYDGVALNKDEQRRYFWNHFSPRKIMCGLGFLVIGLAVAIGVPIALGKRHKSTAVEGASTASAADSSASPTPNPSADPTLKPSEDPSQKPSADPTSSAAPTSRLSAVKTTILEAALSASLNTTALALMNEKSPQHKALEWLVGDDEHVQSFDDTESLVQRFALGTLHFATGGNESWKENYGFLSNITECEWNVEIIYWVWNETRGQSVPTNFTHGVWCDEEDKTVEGIHLEGNRLKGNIPEELGLLTGLKVLNFHVNELTGTLPVALNRLNNLDMLNLNFNSLNGTLPFASGNTNFPHLQELQLKGNSFTGTVPPGLFAASNLAVLSLERNQLSGTFPAEIGELSTLRELELNGNLFSGSLPSGMWSLTHLQGLSLGSNMFSDSLPTGISTLTELQGLWLNENEFSGPLPSSIGTLTNLEALWFDKNRFSGPVPSTIGSLTNLKWLHLHMNRFTGSLPDSLHNLTGLQRLVVSRNKFTGTVPDIFGNMTDLSELFLDINKFTGQIPTSLGHLEGLRYFSIANNSVIGDMNSVCKKYSRYFIADCYGDDPEVICDCCGFCCSDNNDSSDLTVNDLHFFILYFGDGNLPGCFRIDRGYYSPGHHT